MRAGASPGRILAEFESADAMLEALRRLRAEGYDDLDNYSAFEVPGAEALLGVTRSKLPWLVGAAAVLGGLLSYGVQWYVNVWSYPLNAGGRPAHAAPAFIPVTFEGMILAGAVAAFVGLVVMLRLPKLWHPVFEVEDFERVSLDRFWVRVGRVHRNFDTEQVVRVLERAGATRILRLEGST